MKTFVEVNGNKYLAIIGGRIKDKDWDDRESKSIRLEMAYEQAKEIFVDDVEWNILQEIEVKKDVIDEETGDITFETVVELESYDNSDFCVTGDIIDHRDGTITIKMGKPTAEELLAMIEGVL